MLIFAFLTDLPRALFLYNQEQRPGLNKEAAKTATTTGVVTYRQFSFP